METCMGVNKTHQTAQKTRLQIPSTTFRFKVYTQSSGGKFGSDIAMVSGMAHLTAPAGGPQRRLASGSLLPSGVSIASD